MFFLSGMTTGTHEATLAEAKELVSMAYPVSQGDLFPVNAELFNAPGVYLKCPKGYIFRVVKKGYGHIIEDINPIPAVSPRSQAVLQLKNFIWPPLQTRVPEENLPYVGPTTREVEAASGLPRLENETEFDYFKRVKKNLGIRAGETFEGWLWRTKGVVPPPDVAGTGAFAGAFLLIAGLIFLLAFTEGKR